MSIGLFIDGAYVWHVFQERINYSVLRNHIETELNDQVDEGYFFNADDDPPRAQKLHNALAFPPPNGPGLRVKIYWLQKKLLFWPKHMGGGPVLHPTIPDMQYEQKSQKAVDVDLRSIWFALIISATGTSWFLQPEMVIFMSPYNRLLKVRTSNFTL